MLQRRIVGFVEGFIATSTPDRHGRSFTLGQLKEMRERIDERPWLFLGEDNGEPPVGKIAASEVRQVNDWYGLWARVEFYQANALKITSEGILPLFGFAPPPSPQAKTTDSTGVALAEAYPPNVVELRPRRTRHKIQEASENDVPPSPQVRSRSNPAESQEQLPLDL